MFKIGDKVICIDIRSAHYNDDILKLNNIYVISKIDNDRFAQFVMLDNNSEYEYFATRFKLLSEVRKEKLDKLLLCK